MVELSHPVVVNFGDVRKGEKKEARSQGHRSHARLQGDLPLDQQLLREGEPPVSWKIISTDPYEFQGQTVRATTIRLTLARQENAFRKEWGIGVRTNPPVHGQPGVSRSR